MCISPTWVHFVPPMKRVTLYLESCTLQKTNALYEWSYQQAQTNYQTCRATKKTMVKIMLKSLASSAEWQTW